MRQESAKPTSKITAAGAGGAIAIIIAWLLGLGGVDVPSGVEAAFATLAALAAGWAKEEH